MEAGFKVSPGKTKSPLKKRRASLAASRGVPTKLLLSLIYRFRSYGAMIKNQYFKGSYHLFSSPSLHNIWNFEPLTYQNIKLPGNNHIDTRGLLQGGFEVIL
jgi:hypothetical protein